MKHNLSKPKGHDITLYKFLKKATRKKGIKINKRFTLYRTNDNKFNTDWINNNGEVVHEEINHTQMMAIYWVYVG